MQWTSTLQIFPVFFALFAGGVLSLAVTLINPTPACAQENDLPCGHGRLQGQVLASDTGLPLEGVMVLMSPRDGSDFVLAGTSDAEGRYHIDVSTPFGSRPVIVRAASPGSRNPRYHLSDFETTVLETVISGTVTTLPDFILAPGATLRGEVQAIQSSEPLTKVEVHAMRQSTESGDFLRQNSTRVDASGVFTIQGLPSGVYAIRYLPIEEDILYANTYSGGVYHPEDAETFELTGTDEVETSIALAVGAVVEGVVRREDTDAGLRNAVIYLLEASDANPRVRSTATAVTGRFLLVGVPPGEYILRAEPSPLLVDASQRDLLPRYFGDERWLEDARIIKVEESNLGDQHENRVRDIDVNLPVGGVIQGVIRDAETGDPLPDIRVSAVMSIDGELAFTNVSASTDAVGQYTLMGTETEIYSVSAGGFDHVTQYFGGLETVAGHDLASGEVEWFELTLDEPVTGIDIALNQLGSIQGRVVDPDGEPIAGIHVRAQRVDNPRIERFGMTDANGEYAIRTAGGEHTVHFNRLILCGCYNNEYYNSQSDTDTPETVAVDAGGLLTNIDATLDCGAVPLAEEEEPESGLIYLPFAVR